MPRLLAIEWDSIELRAVVASTLGGGLEVEHTAALPIPPEVIKNAPATNISDTLKTWLAEIDIARIPTLVAVGGLQVELHELSLPPAPVDELPDLVRYQIQREITSLDENTPLDFVVLSGDIQTPYRILAAIIPAQALAQAHSICHAAGIRLHRMALRPCATASLADRYGDQREGVHLVIHPLANEVDIVAIADRTANLIRTVRLPHDPDAGSDAHAMALIRELRRTIASVRQQAGEQIVNRITICGSRNQHALLAERIGREFDLPAAVLDPLEVVRAPSQRTGDGTPDSGKFAPLIGMLLDEVHATPMAFDFVNPRKRPKERSKTLLYVLAAAAVVLLIAGYGTIQYRRLARMDRAMQSTQRHLNELEQERNASKDPVAKARRIAQWLRTDVNWLDEMDQLSQSIRPLPLQSKDYPADEDIVVMGLRMNPHGDGGTIEFDAVARNREAKEPFQTRLRDAQHSVEIMGEDEETDLPGYGCDFKAAVIIKTPDALDPMASNRSKPSPTPSIAPNQSGS